MYAIKLQGLVSLQNGDETSTNVARKFVTLLYDPQRKEADVHHNLDFLHARLYNKKDISVAQLPPCEITFEQHKMRGGYKWEY